MSKWDTVYEQWKSELLRNSRVYNVQYLTVSGWKPYRSYYNTENEARENAALYSDIKRCPHRVLFGNEVIAHYKDGKEFVINED